LLYARKPEESLTHAKRWVELYPDDATPYTYMIQAYRHIGNESKAFESGMKFHKFLGTPEKYREGLRTAYRKEGLKGYYRYLINFLGLQRGPGGVFPRINLAPGRMKKAAGLYLLAGEKEKAIQGLYRAYKDRDWQMAYLNTNPDFDGLRSDPRFTELLKKMGFPESETQK
jgi:hypothetical protein